MTVHHIHCTPPTCCNGGALQRNYTSKYYKIFQPMHKYKTSDVKITHGLNYILKTKIQINIMGSMYLVNHHPEGKKCKCVQEATYNMLVDKNYVE